MKTNILLTSAIFACASISFAKGTTDAKGANSSYDSYESTTTRVQTQSELNNNTLDKDRSQSVNDTTIDQGKYSTIKTEKTRASSTIKSDSTRATDDTDRSGQKTDQAPRTRE